MLNQLVLAGRIVNIPTEKEEKGTKITISVSRNYKNIEGIYETDNIDIMLYEQMVSNVLEYCKQGDLIGVRGRVETKDNNLIIIADKITYLTSDKEN